MSLAMGSISRSQLSSLVISAAAPGDLVQLQTLHSQRIASATGPA